MKLLRNTYIILCLISSNIFCQIQPAKNIIYFFNGNSIEGKVLKVIDDKVQISIEDIVKTYSSEKIALAFNANGDFVILENLSKDSDVSSKILSSFYTSKPINVIEKDIILKAIPFEIIACNITYNGDAINYKTSKGQSASINKDNVIAIFTKEGGHEFTRDITEVAPLLGDNQKKIEELRSKFPLPNPEPTNPEPNNPPSIIANETRVPVSEHTTTSSKILTESERELYKNKSVKALVDFKELLNTIANKNRSEEEKKLAIKDALKLFTREATIEVTSKNNPGSSKKLPVAEYLKRLGALNYSSVNIEYVEIKFIEEFKQHSDGTYWGTVSGEQQFIGYKKNTKDPVYSDVVRKNYKVKLDPYKKTVSGESEQKWNVLFGDVTVSQ